MTADAADPRPMDDSYRQGWREGAAAVFRALIAGDSGGYIPDSAGIKDKNGMAESWIAVGWVFECLAKVKDDPQPPVLRGDK